MSNISIFAIQNNIKGARPRVPLVQLLGWRFGEQQHFCFSPKEALKVAKAIRKAAIAARDNKKIKEIEMKIEDE